MPPMGGLSLQDALAKKIQERNKAANPGAQQQTPSPQPTPPKPQPIQQQQSKWPNFIFAYAILQVFWCR